MKKFRKLVATLVLITSIVNLIACSGMQASESANSSTSSYTSEINSDSSSDSGSSESTEPPEVVWTPNSSLLSPEDNVYPVDFAIEMKNDAAPVVLQLSDTQIIDSSQSRSAGRVSAYQYDFWAKDKVEERCYRYVRETITETKPDLIILTGDIIYGEFDDDGSVFVDFIEFMESFEVPWAPIFGNHENESKKGVDWQCEQLENAQYCLFDQKELTGNGNYSVGIVQGGKVIRTFFMMDSNGCGAASEESIANGHTVTNVGIYADQQEWLLWECAVIKSEYPDVNFSLACHIQPQIFGTALEYYYDNYIKNIDAMGTSKPTTDFGVLNAGLKSPWDGNMTFFNAIKAEGFDSIFVGHEHLNSASVVCEGIRFQFGQKSSTYDRFNFYNADGSISGGYPSEENKDLKPLIGGTVIPLVAGTGELGFPYIYLCNSNVTTVTPNTPTDTPTDDATETKTLVTFADSDYTTSSTTLSKVYGLYASSSSVISSYGAVQTISSGMSVMDDASAADGKVMSYNLGYFGFTHHGGVTFGEALNVADIESITFRVYIDQKNGVDAYKDKHTSKGGIYFYAIGETGEKDEGYRIPLGTAQKQWVDVTISGDDVAKLADADGNFSGYQVGTFFTRDLAESGAYFAIDSVSCVVKKLNER